MSVTHLNLPEVDFSKTALRTVVCQLRFNPILKIGVDTPVDFQDLVRASLPKFRAEKQAAVEFTITGPGGERSEVPPIIDSLASEPTIWRFISEDNAWTASLAAGHLSLQTRAYTRFPEFAERLALVHDALQTTYGVDHFTRLGLRYINLFTEEDFPGPWTPRFNPHLLGPMSDPLLGASVGACRQQFELNEADWKITIRHGVDKPGVYRLDLDHSTAEAIPPADLFARLSDFNRRVYQVFRWAISQTLYDEMEPHERE